MAERVGNSSLRTTSDSAKIALMASSSHRTTPGGGRTSPAPRQVAILAYPGVQSLDVTGPLEVLDGASRHPDVAVDPEPIFIRDGDVWTSAGVTAGMDLALALVEQDLDREAALTIARHLVLFLRRPGSQSQFSATLMAQQPERESLCEVQREVVENIAGEHSVDAMAA